MKERGLPESLKNYLTDLAKRMTGCTTPPVGSLAGSKIQIAHFDILRRPCISMKVHFTPLDPTGYITCILFGGFGRVLTALCKLRKGLKRVWHDGREPTPKGMVGGYVMFRLLVACLGAEMMLNSFLCYATLLLLEAGGKDVEHASALVKNCMGIYTYGGPILLVMGMGLLLLVPKVIEKYLPTPSLLPFPKVQVLLKKIGVGS